MRRERDEEWIRSRQTHPLPPAQLPRPPPRFGGAAATGPRGALSPRALRGCPTPPAAPRGLLRRDKGRPPSACERPECSAVSCREALISFPRGSRGGRRGAEGGRWRGGVGVGAGGGRLRPRPGEAEPPSPAWVYYIPATGKG